MPSPILRSFDKVEDVRAIRVTYVAANTNAIDPFDTVPLNEVKPSEGIQIKLVPIAELDTGLATSVYDAEDQIINSLVPTEVENVEVTTNSGNQMMSLVFEVNRAASRIAMRTRRGMGNVVLAGKAVSDIVTGHEFFEPVDNVQVGRWTLKGTFNNMTFYEGDGLPDNEVVVAYNNTNNSFIDGPGGIVESEDGCMTVALGNTMTTLGNVADYLQRLVVTNVNG